MFDVDVAAEYGLKEPAQFEYLKLSNCYTLPEVSDEEMFERVKVNTYFSAFLKY